MKLFSHFPQISFMNFFQFLVSDKCLKNHRSNRCGLLCWTFYLLLLSLKRADSSFCRHHWCYRKKTHGTQFPASNSVCSGLCAFLCNYLTGFPHFIPPSPWKKNPLTPTNIWHWEGTISIHFCVKWHCSNHGYLSGPAVIGSEVNMKVGWTR